MADRKLTSLADIVPAPYNPRQITPQALEGLAVSVQHFGDISGIVWNSRTGHLVAGHQRMKVLRSQHGDGLRLVRGKVVTPDGEKFPVRVVDWDADREKLANLAANNPEIAGVFTASVAEMVKDLEQTELAPLVADLRIDTMVESLRLPGEPEPGLTDPDAVPPVQLKPVSRTGDLWLCGDHPVLCGDSTQQGHVNRLLAGQTIDGVITDPPYCSGGFQEAGRGAGSVGTTANPAKIANDSLSSRGYQSLLKRSLGCAPPAFIYVFTDWRMWVYLFDVAESSGFGVRNMVVWDKGTPGMGRGWRSQHELIMFASRASLPFDPHIAQGNVVACKRTGNVEHTTEKPVELIATLMRTTDFASVYYDPFLGSGTTMIAAEQLGRRCFGLEIEPRYVDVVVRRWQKFTGRSATLDGDGRTFDAQAAEGGKM